MISETPIIGELEQITSETEIEKVNEIFATLIAEIQSYLDLTPVRKKVKIEVSPSTEPKADKPTEEKIFSVGVKRDFDSNSLILFKDYSKYYAPIILREAYNCFLPNTLLAGKYVQVIIHQLVVNNLPKFKLINEWKSEIDQKIVDIEFIKAYFDRYKKFLEDRPRVQLVFQFLREKEPVIDNMGDALYENIVNAFMWKSTMAMNDDELIESLRVLFNLFKEHKSYKSLEEYMGYFQQYSAAEKTEQSQREFVKNMGWIKDHSSISPSYQVNWMCMNIALTDFYLKFNPLLKKEKIIRVMERFPFFAFSMRLRSNASTEIAGYFLVPILYLKDLLSLIQKMYAWGYLLERQCHRVQYFFNHLNLNYFREFHRSQKKLINIDHQEYNQDFELEFALEYRPSSSYPKLSILDLLILERAVNFSFTGFTFEKRVETLNLFRGDLDGMITSEEKVVNDIKSIFKQLNSNPEYKTGLLLFIDKFHNSENNQQEAGFFYIQFILEDLLECLKNVYETLSKNPKITNIYQLRDYITINGVSNDLKTNILFNNKQINQMIFNDFIPLYFQSKKEFNTRLEKFQFFNNFFTLCSRIKIFDLNLIRKIVERKEEGSKIYNIRKSKLTNYYEIFNPKYLKSEHIKAKLDEFIEHDPPIIKPILMNTIATSAFCNYFPSLILRDTPETRRKVERVIRYFPRSHVNNTRNLFTKEKRIVIIIYLPNIKEKDFLLSVLQSLFSDDLVSFNRIYWGGLDTSRFILRDFYDFDTKRIFYNKDLYDQFFLYMKRSLGEVSEIPHEIPHSMQRKLWYTKKTLSNLSKEVEKRYSLENIQHDKISFDTLLKFHTNLSSNLMNNNLSPDITQSSIIDRYVKSIKFIPAFQRFGFSQYFLFIHPFKYEDPDKEWKLDWNLLLSNTFQNIKYPIRIDRSTSLFIKYIFPYRNPNMTYINWLTKSKRVIREYFIFFAKKLTQLFHFNSNFNEDNSWNYDADRFEIHIQNILFNPDYRRQISKIKQYNLGALKSSEIFGPNSDEFKKLVKIYDWKADNLKPYYDKKNSSKINLISDLLQKELIFPFLTLKNLNLLEKVYIILPNVKKEVYQKIVQIFDFFNFGFIYEIEGEYFINGMDKEIQFENGIMIKLYFPDCKMFQFQDLFEQLFQYLKIEHYLILNDLTDGKRLLKLIYNDLGFLRKYNPLKNLIWNDKDRRWMNHKLFNEKFEPVYPPLILKEENES